MRGTLHVVRAADVGWLHGLFAPRLRAANRRRLAQLGVEDAAGHVARIEGALPATRAELAALVGTAGGQALVHVLVKAAIEGVLMLSPDRVFIPFAGAPDRRPAGRAGAPLRRMPRGCDARGSRLLVGAAAARRPRGVRRPARATTGPVPLRLLGAFDELLLGWKDRTPIVPAAHARAVHPGGGILRPLVLEDGEARGTWSQPGGVVKLDLWRRVMDTAALEAEIAAISR